MDKVFEDTNIVVGGIEEMRGENNVGEIFDSWLRRGELVELCIFKE